LNFNGIWQSSNVFTNLAGGSYVPYAKDSTGYQVQAPAQTINVPTQIKVLEVLPRDVTTYHGHDGSIFVRVWGGIGLKQVSISMVSDEWSPWHDTINNEYTFEYLGVGGYDLRVKDANGCIFYYPTRIDINQPAQTTKPPLILTFILELEWAGSGGLLDGMGGQVRLINHLGTVVETQSIPNYSKSYSMTFNASKTLEGYKLDFSKTSAFYQGLSVVPERVWYKDPNLTDCYLTTETPLYNESSQSFLLKVSNYDIQCN